MQKFPAEEFSATAKFSFTPKTEGEKFGLVVMGMSYANIAVTKKADGLYINYTSCKDSDKGNPEAEKQLTKFTNGDLYFRVSVSRGAVCSFSYSDDGISFKDAGEKFIATPGRWIGATMGFFCSRTQTINDAGFAEVDWFRVASLQP
jgi:hypothetical protein